MDGTRSYVALNNLIRHGIDVDAHITHVVDSSTTSLRLASLGISDRQLQTISGRLSTKSELREVYFNFNKLVYVRAFANLDLLRNITTLDLSYNHINDESFRALADAIRRSRIVSANFSHNDMSATGAGYLADVLKSHSTFRHLKLQNNFISATGACALARALEGNVVLQSLDLGNNQIEDTGATAIAGALKSNKALHLLDVVRNNIADDGALAFEELLKHNRVLVRLDLSENIFSKGVAKLLVNTLSSNKALQVLHLRGTNIALEDSRLLTQHLSAATRKGNLELAQFFDRLPDLLKSGKKYSASWWDVGATQRFRQSGTASTILHFVAKYDRADVAQIICEGDPEAPARTDFSGRTSLHVACEENSIHTAEFLLSLETTDVNVQSSSKAAPLHDASRRNRVDMMELLLKHGAYVNATDDQGRTPLMLVSEVAAAEVLLKHSANAFAKDGGGRTAVDHVLDNPKRGQGIAKAIKEAVLKSQREDQKKRFATLYDGWVQHQARMLPKMSALLADVKTFGAFTEPSLAAAVERVRTGEYNVSIDTFFDATRVDGSLAHEHAHVLNALAYESASRSNPPLCDLYDVDAALAAYRSSAAHIHALYLLACARMERMTSSICAPLVGALLSKFLECGTDLHSWLTDEEKDALTRVVTEPSEEASGEGETATLMPYEKTWNELKPQLTKEQCKPMDELLKMTGLHLVKEKAVSIYSGILDDQRMRTSGLEAAVGRRDLNFAFVGNPGTGKTTVSELFADLIRQAGARAGNKFIKMTAHEALRKGPVKFAAELASLTGGRKDAGPPPAKPYRKGLQVEVQLGEDDKYYPASVLQLPRKEGEKVVGYSLALTDGTELADVAEDSIRPVSEGELGGVLFIDEAYDLEPASNKTGAAIMAEIMNAASEHKDRVTIILAGYKDDIESKLYSFNVGMASRFDSIVFEDFSIKELSNIWTELCSSNKWTCDDLVAKVASRRVGRSIGTKGFGNARDMGKLFNRAVQSAKSRLLQGSGAQVSEDQCVILVEDVIGKRPARKDIPELDEALTELEGMTGLGKVKKSVDALWQLARNNYDYELKGETVDTVPLNRIFLGNPGTGKTTVAEIYGRVLKALRLLTNGDVIKKSPSDFMGDVVGASAQKTKSIMELAEGKVLVIDEAYGLNDSLYGKQALDTIVEKLDAEGNIAVCLLGYDEPIRTMLREQNPGLSRRFALENALQFEDFSDEELFAIVSTECRRLQVVAPIAVKHALVKNVARLRDLPNFGNAGTAKNAIKLAKSRMTARLQRESSKRKEQGLPGTHPDLVLAISDLVADDVDDKEMAARDDPLVYLSDIVGMEEFRETLAGIGSQIRVRRAEGRSTTSGLVGNYVFTGSPGTGKTTVARKMAQILHAFGILHRPHCEITSAQDLCGQYVGQTKKVVEEKMRLALGGILFIDEAYELGKSGFGDEAMTKLLSMLTEPTYQHKVIVILAGYEEDMHSMLKRNVGLKSRFTEFVHFNDWKPNACTDFVLTRIESTKPVSLRVGNGSTDDVADGESRASLHKYLSDAFESLRSRDGWANVRDAEKMLEFLVRARDVRLGKSGANMSSSEVPSVLRVDFEAASKQFLDCRPPTAAAAEHADGPHHDRQLSLKVLPSELVHSVDAFLSRLNNGGKPPMQFRTQDAPSAPLRTRQSEATRTAEALEHDEDAKDEEEEHDHCRDEEAAAEQAYETYLEEVRAALAAADEAYRAGVEEALRQEEVRLRREAELEKERLAALEEERRLVEEMRLAKEAEAQRAREHEERMAAEKAAAAAAKDEAEKKRLEAEQREELARRLAEKLRLERLEREREVARKLAEARRLTLQREREKAREAQEKERLLRSISSCPQGFAWTKTGTGYVCCGGGHEVTQAELDREYTTWKRAQGR